MYKAVFKETVRLTRKQVPMQLVAELQRLSNTHNLNLHSLWGRYKEGEGTGIRTQRVLEGNRRLLNSLLPDLSLGARWAKIVIR